MPPAPPNSSTRRKVLSLPARTERPSIGPSSSSLACLTATMLSIVAELGQKVRGGMLTITRAGMLYITIGSSGTAAATASKWARRPARLGLL